VVAKDVPDFTLVYGNPAKVHGWVCQCGKKLEKSKKNNYICKKCKREYIPAKKTLIEK
jgi:UDP-2-acetamido-3-amino-2,3-dideoxy-glucuronate N-acetyltransferase